MKNNIKRYILIPDVHGREFWKDAVRDLASDTAVVFMGDYLDTYPFENIPNVLAIANFKEILEFKKSHPNQVALLLGNHDLHYHEYLSTEYKCRYIREAYYELRQLFMDNWPLFSVAKTIEIGGRKYLLTHAGVCKEWMEYVQKSNGGMDYELNFDEDGFNSLLESEFGIQLLWTIGYSRGGMFPVGSFIWADYSDHKLSEMKDVNSLLGVDCQIFAHSLAVNGLDGYVIADDFAMIDCRKAFLLDEAGNLDPIE